MNSPVPSFLIGSSFLLVTRTCIKAWMSLNFGQIAPLTRSKLPLSISEKLMYNVVNTLAPLFLIGSSNCLQVKRTTITYGINLKYSQI